MLFVRAFGEVVFLAINITVVCLKKKNCFDKYQCCLLSQTVDPIVIRH